MPNQIRLQIDRRVSFADGQSFGQTGPYERLVGKAAFAVEPTDPGLASIVDLDLAPRNAEGLIEFEADLDILAPVDRSRGNRRLLYDVNNRGNRTVLTNFNEAQGSPDPTTAEHAGNGFLMREGYTVVWSGWQGDLVAGSGLLVAHLPEARQNGAPIRGRVRQEFIAEQDGVLSLPVSGGANIQCYPVLDRAAATLTLREHEAEPREAVPDDQWQLAKAQRSHETGRVEVTPSNIDLYPKDGFRPGWIYELIYDTEGTRVMGLGLFGVRELVSFLRYESAGAAGGANPLAGAIDKAYTYGSSLSARVVRQFVYEGFNADAGGRRVFDAVFPNKSGGGRVFLNQRFAQVGRFPRQHEEHQWPSERYPFAYSAVPDAFSESIDSVLKRPDSDPVVVHTHSSSEYWQRHASLGQTDPATGEDVEEPATVRIYHLAGMPHGARAGAAVAAGEATFNALSSAPFLRACLRLMDRWVTDSVAPPPSRLPRRSEGTLESPEAVLGRFPATRSLKLPASPSRLPLYDYGQGFQRDGINDVLPPRPVDGKEYSLFLPQVDKDGNEIAGLRSPDLEAPVGTFTGWYVRRGPAEGDLLGLSGTFIPFARTRAEREAIGDSRPSIEERYPSHDAYVAAVTGAVARLQADGFLLDEDAEKYIAAAKARNPFDPATPLGPLLQE